MMRRLKIFELVLQRVEFVIDLLLLPRAARNAGTGRRLVIEPTPDIRVLSRLRLCRHGEQQSKSQTKPGRQQWRGRRSRRGDGASVNWVSHDEAFQERGPKTYPATMTPAQGLPSMASRPSRNVG
jgi:hypothetical protein